MVRPEEVDLTHIREEVDVLVIGGGGGGASAALFAAEHGAKVLITTKLRFGDSNTIMAEGGIQAAVGKFDSPLLRYLDTMGGGGFQNLPNLVNALVCDAPMILEWLAQLGVMFDRKDDGDLLASFAGGQCRRRDTYLYLAQEVMIFGSNSINLSRMEVGSEMALSFLCRFLTEIVNFRSYLSVKTCRWNIQSGLFLALSIK